MNKIVCSARGIECDCSETECRSAAPMPTPYLSPSIRTQWCALFIGLTLIGSVVAYAALASADEGYRLQQLDRQEASVQWTR